MLDFQNFLTFLSFFACIWQVTSSLTGPVVVEDVVYENVDGDISRLFPSEDLIFRRLVFGRTEGLVQSEALLIRDETQNKVVEIEKKKSITSSKSKKKANQKLHSGIYPSLIS